MNRFIKIITVAGLWLIYFAVLLSSTLKAQSTIGFTIEGATVTEQNTFVIAVKADSLLTGKGVYAFRFGLSYNADYLEFLNIDSVGSVLKNWGMPAFGNKTRGRILIAGAGSSALQGNGNMFYLKFKALRGGNTTIDNLLGESSLNEGTPLIAITSGGIQAEYISYPDIYPDDFQLFVGEEVQMYVNGGTDPYTYSTVDKEVAVISNQTMVKGKGPGITKVYVTDKNGYKSYISGNIDVRAVRLSPVRVTAWPKEEFYLPIRIEIAPGTKIYSGYFELVYNGNVEGIKQSAKSADYEISIQNNAATDLMKVSFAAPNGITGSGILCYLKFKAINSGYHSFYLQNMLFNENLSAFRTVDCAEIYYLPELDISPNSGTMMWGETQKLTVTGGTPPLSYKLSNTSLGSIDDLGNLKGLSGGRLKVTAIDSHGATKTSGDFLIYDNAFRIENTDGVLDRVVRVPFSTSQLPEGKKLYDFDGTISFDENELEFIGLETVDSGMMTDYAKNGNVVHIVGASGSGIKSGIVCYLRFKLKNTLSIGQKANIALATMTGNESSLFSTLTSGQIIRTEQLSYRPVAKAGQNFSVYEGETATLDGSESYDEDGDPITFKWKSPVGIQLIDNTLKKSTFTAPNVKTNSVLTFTLVVNDGTSDSDSSKVMVTVLNLNNRPVANAGPDKSYIEGASVSLDGSLSSDPDMDVISFKWTSLEGIILFDPYGSAPSFIAPQVTSDKFYRFKLEVSDGVLISLADTVQIKVLQVNKKPVAFAGGDQTVNEGTLVQLDGSLSSDPDNEPITYKWISPSIVTLSSTIINKPTFTAPMVHRDSVLVFSLVVNDGRLNSDTDKVFINVKNLNILSAENQILKAELTGADSTKIDQVSRQIFLYVPYGCDIRALAPNFLVSPKASINPASGSTKNFTSPVSYTVTAEDGTTSRTYTVSVYIPAVTLKRTLSAGWNWISLSATPSDFKIGAVLGGLSLANLDYLKSATTSAVYYTTSGWFGDLITLPQFESMMFKKSTSEVFSLTGKEINPTLVSIPVSIGWNRIGYLLKGNAAIGGAFDESTLPTGEILLKGKDASSIYYPGTGWLGDLDSLKVLTGYMMKTASNGNIKYKATGARLKSIQQNVFTRDELFDKYKISPSLFENSANLISEVRNEFGENIIRHGDLLIAYSQAIPMGVAEACFVPDLNQYVFILTVFSNSTNEKLSFSLKSLDNNLEKNLSEEISFKPNDIIGQSRNPFPLHLTDIQSGIEENKLTGLVSVFPNPVTDYLHIKSAYTLNSVVLFGISGNCIRMLTGLSGNYVQLNVMNLYPGVYSVKVETSNGTLIRKLIKLNHK